MKKLFFRLICKRPFSVMLTIAFVFVAMSSGAFIVKADDTVTYYVSSSGGNDNNNGLSTSTPWQTLTKLNDISFNPGDTICLKSGDTWTSQEFAPTCSGTSANYITLTSYGTGNMPIITTPSGDTDSFILSADNTGLIAWSQHDPSVTSLKIAIKLKNVQYWEINGIEISHAMAGIYTCNTSNTPIQGYRIIGCYIHDMYDDGPNYGTSGDTFDGMLRVTCPMAIDIGAFTKNVYIKDCTITNCLGGIWEFGSRSNSYNDGNGNGDGFLIDNLTMDRCTWWGVYQWGSDYFTLQNSHISNCGKGVGSFPDGMWHGTAAYQTYWSNNTKILNNDFGGSVGRTPYNGDGGAIDIDQGSNNVLVDGNILHDGPGSPIEFLNNATTNVTVSNNICYNNGYQTEIEHFRDAFIFAWGNDDGSGTSNNWTSYSNGGGTMTWDSTTPYYGSKSLKVYASTSAGSEWYQGVAGCEGGQEYTASVWIKTSAITNSAAYLDVLCSDSNGACVGDYTSTTHVNGTTDWTKYSVTFTAPATTAGITVCGLVVGGTGTAWFDLFSLKQSGQGIELLKDAGAENNCNYSNIVLENNTIAILPGQSVCENANTSVMYGDFSVLPSFFSYSGNIISYELLNSTGAEDGSGTPDNWVSYTDGGGTMTWDSTTPHYENNSLKVYASTSAGSKWYQCISGELGAHQYTASVWIKTSSITNSAAYLDVLCLDSSGTNVGDYSPTTHVNGTTDWTLYTFTFTAPATTASITVCGLVVGGTGTAWFDDFCLLTNELIINTGAEDGSGSPDTGAEDGSGSPDTGTSTDVFSAMIVAAVALGGIAITVKKTFLNK